MAEAETTLGALRQVILPVASIDDALPFFRDELGLELRFRDGDRWAALALGDLTLALAGPGEQPDEERVALGVKVTGLDEALERLGAAGGRLVQPPQTGAHERRATWRRDDGTVLALYEPIA